MTRAKGNGCAGGDEKRGLGGFLRSLLSGLPWHERAEADETLELGVPPGGLIRVDNGNGCTVSTGGLLSMTFTPADNVILNANMSSERHVALFEYTYAAGLKAGKEEVLIDVTNLSRTT